MMDDLIGANRLHTAAHVSLQGRARHALVSAVDPNTHSVKVTIQPEATVSGWVPDPGIACAGLRIACPSEVGTQVLIVPVEGDAEHPVIVARLFDTVMQPPVSPATGKPVQPGEIGFFLSDGTYLHMSPGIIAMKATLQIDGTIQATQDILAKTVSLQGHVHGGVSPGSASTAGPVVP